MTATPSGRTFSGAIESPAGHTVGRIEVRDLSVRYGPKVALEGVSLDVHPGRVLALIGPSGCGKTSFLNCLNRLSDLIPTCQVGGSVRLDGQDIFAPPVDVVGLRRRVGMIFQKPNPFPMSIRKNVELALREHGVGEQQQLDQIVETVLRDVGLWDEVKDRLHGPALGLSGGQQQRLCLARSLALKPDVLLLDEPCSALDPIASGIVEDHIAALGGRYTLVVVTHNLAQARRIASDVAMFWMRDGRGCLVEHGPAHQVFDSPADPITASYISGGRG